MNVRNGFSLVKFVACNFVYGFDTRAVIGEISGIKVCILARIL